MGSLLGGGRTAYLVAAAIAITAAAGELRGVRIVPQIRRQVPEHWRRVMPMPVAAGLYGVLLGLGFTTFVLTLGVWALAGMSVVAGDVRLGLVVGLAFGAGRALPVAVLAPIADTRAGTRVIEVMAERPAVLRGFRLADGLALSAAAVVLLGAGDAEARPAVVASGSNPSVADRDLAWQNPSGRGIVRRNGRRPTSLPGRGIAIGGPYAAVRSSEGIQLFNRRTLRPVRTVRLGVPRIDAFAVSARWLVVRARMRGGGDRLIARRLDGPGRQRAVASIGSPGQLSRPSLAGDLVLFAANGRRANSIVSSNLRSGRRRTLLSSTKVQLTNPAASGRSLLYVRTGQRRQQLRLTGRRRPGAGRVLYSIRTSPRTVLWSTALSSRDAYVTRLRFRGGFARPTFLRIRR